MVFFPSHAFLREIYAVYAARYPEDGETELVCQSPDMKEADRQAFLARFDEVRDTSTLLGFCVLGGLFGEGIDLRGDRLIGSLIVGTGLPQVGTEREVVRDYFEEKRGDGFAYAYQYPGMNKVLQAAGRVIRTETDTGIVVLLDDRFLTPAYRRLMPAEWTEVRRVTSRDAEGSVSRFWDEWL